MERDLVRMSAILLHATSAPLPARCIVLLPDDEDDARSRDSQLPYARLPKPGLPRAASG